MTYNATYHASDMSAATIDVIVSMGTALLSFVTVIVIVWILAYLKKKLQ